MSRMRCSAFCEFGNLGSRGTHTGPGQSFDFLQAPLQQIFFAACRITASSSASFFNSTPRTLFFLGLGRLRRLGRVGWIAELGRRVWPESSLGLGVTFERLQMQGAKVGENRGQQALIGLRRCLLSVKVYWSWWQGEAVARPTDQTLALRL